MTVDESSPSGQGLDQFKCLLVNLPVSQAAFKKVEIEINDANGYIEASIEKKVNDGDKDEDDLIIDLNDTLPEYANDGNYENMDQEVPVENSSRVLCSISPVSLLLELSQRNSVASNVKWEELCKNGLFGYKVDYNNKFWIVPAEYSRKKEAKTMVALMACTELIGDNILFESIELKKYESWTKASVRKDSDELFKIYENFKADIILGSNS